MNYLDVENLRKQFPKGTRIRCQHMNDPYHPIPPGTIGVVEHVDDAGQIHMKWDNGSSLALIPGEDSFTKVRSPVKKKEEER